MDAQTLSKKLAESTPAAQVFVNVELTVAGRKLRAKLPVDGHISSSGVDRPSEVVLFVTEVGAFVE